MRTTGRLQAGGCDVAAGIGLGEPLAVDWVGLEDHQCVEQDWEAGRGLDVGQSDVVVGQECCLPVLKPGEEVRDGVAG